VLLSLDLVIGVLGLGFN